MTIKELKKLLDSKYDKSKCEDPKVQFVTSDGKKYELKEIWFYRN